MSISVRDEAFEALLHFLRQSRGFDFTGYKRSTLMRRVRKRMDQVAIGDSTEYMDYLQVHPEEFALLFNTILINVTSFFRDPPAWEYLTREVIPRLLASKLQAEAIRVWSAGCASGEEAYTISIVLAEILGMTAYRQRVKIYATDVDEDALSRARQGGSTEKDLQAMPAELRDKYFELNGSRYIFRADLRRSIIFGRHDLLQDAPISRIDLLLCRNTLMYFQAETQARILARLHYALSDKGFLFLGKAEMLLTQDSLFTPVDLKIRIFTKVPKIGMRERLLVLAQAGNIDAGNHLGRQLRLREALSDASPVAQVVIDAGGYLAMINAQARSVFGLSSNDLGRPLQDLELSYRPVELRSRIETVYRDRQAIDVTDAQWQLASGEVQYIHVHVEPLIDVDGSLLGASVAFVDVTSAIRLRLELERSKQELETASEELQSTNEELETTNEELQSTVEELETTNEELQSSNEELETMNEELESTNSELQALNAELHQRSSQLNRVNSFMESILASIRVGMAVVDKDFHIQLWNHKAEDLWGIRSAEVEEQSLLNLDIGLPVAELAEPIRDCLTGKASYREVVLDSTNRRGRSIHCRVVCTPLSNQETGAQGVILLMEEVEAPRPLARR